ncbi:MAG: EamA family transporter [Deltaproteobacteria bacterium]|nr:EamA family transporter [Deltaproteobacteria bacterium]
MGKDVILALITAFVWGLAPAFEKAGLSGRIDPFTGVVIRTIPIALAAGIGLIFMGRLGEIQNVGWRSAAYVAAGGVLAGLIGQFTFYSALKNGSASVVVPMAATYPLFALVLSIVFLGETITWQRAAGACLVVGGVMLLK